MYKRENISWIDSGFSISSNVWQDIEDIKELLENSKTVNTIGYNVFENHDWVVLVQSVNCPTDTSEEDLFRGGYFIYKPCILARQEVRT
jgi:malate/lactate dehydrogenase